MPICDGFESISLIRMLETMQMKLKPIDGTAPLTPAIIVALTGLGSQRDREAAMSAGANYFVTKPLKFSNLKELLVEWGLRRPPL
jgi:CheY-like chemotaxis protein